MRIRTAIFGVYVAASACGFAAMMAFVLRDVRLRYVESMRRTMGDTAAFLAGLVAPDAAKGEAWPRRLSALPPQTELLRVFACDAAGRVLFDSARGRDVGQVYSWPLRGGGRTASEDYTLSNVAEVNGELRVAAPVRRGTELVGWVGVGRALSTVAEGVRSARRSLGWSLGLIAGGMVAAGWWIASRLTHSLERLTSYALAVRDGRPVAPPASRAKEVSALARAFEEMRVALEGKAYVEHYTQALAHELKAPLTSIRGAAELLAENPPEAERARFVTNLRAESERLQHLVDRLLKLAALESRRTGTAMTEVAVAEILQAVRSAAQAVAVARSVALTFEVPAEVRVRGERFLLEQCLGNLVQNALEFTPAGGTVRVQARPENGTVIIVVEDTGSGVPDYALAKVFDRFYSLPRPDTGRKSSGLGLSIAREVARLHGGAVMLENRSEGGARATLVLPAAADGQALPG
jgi:two-component system sensor histidine kinase CreC